MHTILRIEYANPTNHSDVLPVDFKLRQHSFIRRWIERVNTAQARYFIDCPGRFYGFGTLQQQQDFAMLEINKCIDNVNTRKELIWRRPESVYDQDTLNYLHHIFEVFHGLLDQQDYTDVVLEKYLAELNILVHRCESVARGADPRHVVTWYGLPKDRELNVTDYKLFTDEWEFGTVMLNYAEIGKTLEDLTLDKDTYIGKAAFQPYKHYSADFNVKFYATNPVEVKEKRAKIYAYYEANRDHLGPWNVSFAPGSIPLADITTQVDLKEIEARQYVKSVKFI